MQHHFPILFENIYLKRDVDGKNNLAVENIQVIAEGELVKRFSVEQYVFLL
jgi:hypothetical protein